MKFVIEKSIYNRYKDVLSSVQKSPYNINTSDVKIVDNISSEPHIIINFYDINNREWKIIWSQIKGVAFIVDYNLHSDEIKSYAGGATGDGDKVSDNDDNMTIIVYPQDTSIILKYRTIHEYLHSIDLPADDLDKHSNKFMNFIDLLYYKILNYYNKQPEHIIYFQDKYYKWLLVQRDKNLM